MVDLLKPEGQFWKRCGMITVMGHFNAVFLALLSFSLCFAESAVNAKLYSKTGLINVQYAEIANHKLTLY